MPREGWLTQETQRRIDLWDETKDLYWNAKNLGLEKMNGLYQFARLHGLKYVKQRSGFSKKILKLKTEKMSQRKIAEELGCTISHVHNLLKEHNLPHLNVKTRILYSHGNYKEVIKYLRDNGFAYADIGRLYRVSRQRIEQLEKDK